MYVDASEARVPLHRHHFLAGATVALALVAVWLPITLIVYARLTAPTAAQRAAIAVVSPWTPPPPGENGFTILKALRDRDGDWPTSATCRDAESCIERVRSNEAQFSAAIREHAAVLDEAERALRAPIFRNPVRDVTIDAVLPPFQIVMRLPLVRAQAHVMGERTAALAATCRDAGDFVRWSRDHDSVIHAMIAAEGFAQSAALIAEMRQAEPAGELPQACVPLLEIPDPAADGLICDGARTEWRVFSSWLPGLQSDGSFEQPSLWAALTHHPEQFSGRLAERFAGFCGVDAANDARDDGIDLLRIDPAPRAIDRIAFPVTDIMAEDTGGATYVRYWERQLDLIALRRLLAATLRVGPVRDADEAAARFAALPPSLRDGPRPLQLDADGRSLVVILRAERFEPIGGAMRFGLPVHGKE